MTMNKTVAIKLWNISDIHLQNILFLRCCDQQMVAEIELKAFNQIRQGNFAATVTDIQLIEWWTDVHST